MNKKAILVLAALLLASASVFLHRAGMFWTDSSSSTALLVHELTRSPERQQAALDALAEYDGKKLTQLLPYLTDDRQLASADVKFLNTSPKAFEKYYMTQAGRVDELLIRYICWSTGKCDPIFDARELEKARRDAKRALNTLPKD